MKPPRRVQMKVGEFYTLQGAAQALGVSYWTVYRYVRVAGIPTRQLSTLTLVKLEDLRELGTPGTAPHPPAGRASDQEALARTGSMSAAALLRAQVCPQCGDTALVHEEGCQKCYACGYSAC